MCEALRRYFDEGDDRPLLFAERLNVPPATVYRWINGERIPNRRHMPLVIEQTGGRVTADSFYSRKEQQ